MNVQYLIISVSILTVYMYVVILTLNKNSQTTNFFLQYPILTGTFQQHKFIFSIISISCCTYRSECSKFADENNIDKKYIVTIVGIV